MESERKCGAILVAHDGNEACECELPAKHRLSGRQGRPKNGRYSFKHRKGGVSWTDGGAERIEQEQFETFYGSST